MTDSRMELQAKLRNPAWIEHDGQRLILHPEQTQIDMARAAVEILRLHAALHAVASALCEINRIAPQAIKEHVVAAHAKACTVLDDKLAEPGKE